MANLKQPPQVQPKRPATGKGVVEKQPNPGHPLGPSNHIMPTGKD